MILSSKQKGRNIKILVGLSVLFYFCPRGWSQANQDGLFQRGAPEEATNYESRYLGSFHVGGTYPLGSLDQNIDSNIHFRVDLAYRLTETHYLMFMAGLSQFSSEPYETFDHPRWFNFSINYVLTLGPSPRHYFQIGPGYYNSKSSTWVGGFNIGYGRFIPVYNTPCSLKFGLDWHYLFTDKEKPHFLTFQLGVVFNLGE